MKVTESEQVEADAVISVRTNALREVRAGLGLSLCLLVLLMALQPDWTGVGAFFGVEFAGSVYAAVRAVFKFRGRLDKAEPLPLEAVEATGPKRPPLDAKRAVLAATVVVAGIAGIVALRDSEWVPLFAAVVIAGVIADQFVRPLAVAYLVSRWERAHRHGRLFRSLAPAEDDEERLYVADRPVPAA